MGFRCKCWRNDYSARKSDCVRFRSASLRSGGTAESAVATRVVSLASQQADSRCERAAQAGRKCRLRMGRIDHAVYHERIASPGNVVETSAKRQVVAKKMKPFFQLQVQRKIVGETLRPRFPDQLLLIVDFVERESGARFHRVGDFRLMKDGERKKRQISPREKAVGRVPRIRTRLLRGKNWTIDVEVERLIRARTGSCVGAHQRISLVEVAPQRDLEGVVVILPRVEKDEISRG